MEMRQFFAEKIQDIMKFNSKIILINADLERPNGISEVHKNFPDRVFNVGIAEQNMVSIAAGLASYGMIPMIFSFTPFVTRRVCDQIAISVCYARQNVKIIGTDPGISAELNGGTHMSFEDIGVLRSIPNIVITEPADNNQLGGILPMIIDYNGPVYMRMMRKETQEVFQNDEEHDLFKAKVLKSGDDVTILCSGMMVSECLSAEHELAKIGVSCEIIAIHTIKPFDYKTVLNSVKKTKCIVTAENHNIIGGLFSATCENLAQNFYTVPIVPIGIHDCFGQVGKLADLKKFYKMTYKDIMDAVLRLKNS